MARKLDWDRDGADWPNREASRFVEAGGMRWHVQVAGEGPGLLLLHGTGASTHSWRDLLPRLAERHRVVAPDLPGHGFSETPPGGDYTLPGLARAVATLAGVLGFAPDLLVGHSAGAAIAVRMVLDGLCRPLGIVSVNGALVPYGGMVAPFFAPLARMLAQNPLVPRVFAWQARNGPAVDRLIGKTGSRIDETGVDFYRRLVQTPSHVAGALGMMANWDLKTLGEDLPRLEVPLTLVVGGDDLMVPADDAFQIRRVVPSASVVYLRGLGHLAHEEDPDRFVEIIDRVLVLCRLGRPHDPAGTGDPP
ncbi:alpha/beta fold hydrolase BchO [Prosthecomicrobium sp. N25]|uniref:alpha/beta fold hydrolase BchO n=1 Tax=Prosthecomicrobium sp. N25 TaxID=3129254 RepID=UPI003FCE059A